MRLSEVHLSCMKTNIPRNCPGSSSTPPPLHLTLTHQTKKREITKNNVFPFTHIHFHNNVVIRVHETLMKLGGEVHHGTRETVLH